MIFVVVGTQKFQLNRLLKWIDILVEKNVITEEVYAQVGNSDYKPLHYKYDSFLSKEEFEKQIQKCDILITHSGVGTIMSGLHAEKKIIVFPRLKKYKEHVDDHQIQIAKAFSEQNFVLCCMEGKELKDIIRKSRNHHFSKYISRREVVVKTIHDYLESF